MLDPARLRSHALREERGAEWRIGVSVRRCAVTVVMCVVALALSRAASAADIGANDDTGKYAADSGAIFFPQMAAFGLKQTVMTTRFLSSEPTAVQDGAALDRAIPLAQLSGLRVTLAVYPYPPREVEARRATPEGFASWLTLVAQRYPSVKQFVVMNEPNQPAFMRPQFDATGVNVSAAKAGAFLAAGYDALKAVDPAIRVVGIGLSPRGNDRPTVLSNISTSPVRFLTALGGWYRASGRRLPLMDGFSFHPYPNRATDALDRGYPWPNAGFANLDRIKQALWDAFRETPQPSTVNGLKIYLDEVGWQVDTSTLEGYSGSENVQVTDEASQAAMYDGLVRASACDPSIAEVNIFGFYDDGPRDSGFQAALNHVDGTPRPSAEAVRAAIADTALGCALPGAPWYPAKHVIGVVPPRFVVSARRVIRFDVAAMEGAEAIACLLPGQLGGKAAADLMVSRSATSVGCVGSKVLPSRLVHVVLRRLGLLRPVTVAVRLVAEASAKRWNAYSRTLL